MRALVRPDAVVFDVGANVGTVTRDFRRILPGATIHAFEPSPTTFEILRENCRGMGGLVLNRCGLGATRGVADLRENEEPTMTSFLDLGGAAWGAVRESTRVEVQTVDDYCARNAVPCIDVLKSDTQGYDLEVLRGASGMLSSGRVELVYVEINFVELYKGQARPEAMLGFLADHAFDPIHFYRFQYWKQRVGWTDVLFQRRDSIAS